MATPKFANLHPLTRADMTAAQTVLLDLKDVDNIGVQVISTGTPTGTYAWKQGNSPTQTDLVTFSPSGAPANPAGAGANTLFSLSQYPYRYVLFTYTPSSGAGTLDLYVCGKAT